MDPLVVIAALVMIAALVVIAISVHRRGSTVASLPARAAVTFSPHALKQMTERGITQDDVMAVLTSPERESRDSEKHSVRLERDFNDRMLKVWVEQPWPSRSGAVIRTAAWTCVKRVNVPAGQVGRLIGHGGQRIERLRKETGAFIHVGCGGNVTITGENTATVERATQRVVATVGLVKLR